jgi:[FeFe] hydrogenase H-cluster maturation GTPase HydF
MELQPIGPVLFVDTAGVDDIGALGAQRIEKTRQAIARTEVAVLVAEAAIWTSFEEKLLAELRARDIPVLIALNKTDVQTAAPDLLARLRQQQISFVQLSARTGSGIDAFRDLIWQAAPVEALEPPTIIRDLVSAGQTAVLVTPIDKEAPKGRIKQLQVQAIRDLLDGGSSCVVVKDAGVQLVLDNMKTLPGLVVSDANVFDQVARVTPKSVPLTAFSILLSRLKGDLVAQTRAAVTIDSLEPGDKVLIAETCTHHPIEEDIGRVKIPRWLNQHVGGELEFTHVRGREFPRDLTPYKLVIHCGACMWNRQEMLSRIRECQRQRVPITNYGMVIAFAQGILERALEPFPAALAAFREESGLRTAASLAVAQEAAQVN